jgi:hypothetical protein
MKSNRNSTFATILFIIITFSLFIYAHNDGQKGRTKMSTDKQGCTCHGDDPDPSVKVVISGPETLEVNMEATYTVTITGGPLKAAGTNIAVTKGKLAPVDKDLKLMSLELSHSNPKKPEGNSVVFKFTYKAPLTVGTETIYADGNSVDGNDKKTGDKWNFAAEKKVVIVSAKVSKK